MRCCSIIRRSRACSASLSACSTRVAELTPRPEKIALALGLRLDEDQPALGFLGLCPGLAKAGLQLLHCGASGVDLGIGLGERQPVRFGIEAHQQVAAATTA